MCSAKHETLWANGVPYGLIKNTDVHNLVKIYYVVIHIIKQVGCYVYNYSAGRFPGK